MDASKSHDSGAIVPAEPATALPRREFLSTVVKAAGGLLLGDLAAASVASAQTAGPAVASQKFTDWGWPQPYEQISTKSKQWLQSKGWWPLNAAWIVVWASEEMIGNTLQTQKLLEKRGIEMQWQTFVAAGFSNEAFIPGRIQIANTGALGVLALLSNKVPMRALGPSSPALPHPAPAPRVAPLEPRPAPRGPGVHTPPAGHGPTTAPAPHSA